MRSVRDFPASTSTYWAIRRVIQYKSYSILSQKVYLFGFSQILTEKLRAIELDGNIARNYVRRSELHTQLSNHQECLDDLKKAQEIDNNFANIERLIQEAEKRLKQASKR